MIINIASKFMIRKENVPKAVEAVKKYIKETFDLHKPLQSDDFLDIITNNSCFTGVYNTNGDVWDLWYQTGEYEWIDRYDFEILKSIAQYVEPGSRIVMMDDCVMGTDSPEFIFAYYFDGSKDIREYSGKIVFPDSPIDLY